MLVPGMNQVPEPQTPHYPGPRCSLIDWTFLLALSLLYTHLANDREWRNSQKRKPDKKRDIFAIACKLLQTFQSQPITKSLNVVDPCICLTKSNTNPKCCLILVTIFRTSLADKCHCSSTTIATTLQKKRMSLASITVTTTLQKTWMNIEHGVHHSIHHISKEKSPGHS